MYSGYESFVIHVILVERFSRSVMERTLKMSFEIHISYLSCQVLSRYHCERILHTQLRLQVW